MLRSNIILLRFPFSIFLMPVYWFALSGVAGINYVNAVLIFIILHLIIYPSSNGYNSYMDRDEGSIGGIENPPPPTKQLFYITVAMDFLGILLSACIGWFFMAGIILYILASRAYSYRGIRLKQYPFIGYATVIIFQGGWVYAMVSSCAGNHFPYPSDFIGMIAASLLVGSFYPLTQIYQHAQDKADGVITISNVLGYRGTFFFSFLVFSTSLLMIGLYFQQHNMIERFLFFTFFFIPVLIYFTWWLYKVHKNIIFANYSNTMKMNIIASACTNAAFIYLFIIQH